MAGGAGNRPASGAVTHRRWRHGGDSAKAAGIFTSASLVPGAADE